MAQPFVVEIWRTGAVDRLPDRLAEHAVFSSPVADYAGRDRVCHMLGLIARVVDDVRPTAVWGGTDRDAVSAFAARVGDEQVEGMLREEYDEAGALEHVTLFLRPYRVLKVAIARMRELLEEDPLP